MLIFSLFIYKYYYLLYFFKNINFILFIKLIINFKLIYNKNIIINKYINYYFLFLLINILYFKIYFFL